MVKKVAQKKLAMIILAIALIWPQAILLAATNLEIGQPCSGPVSGNSECKSGDCEGSVKEDPTTHKKLSFCDCNDAGDCQQKWGPPSTGEWECIDGASVTADLDYCVNKAGDRIEPTLPEYKNNASLLGKLHSAIFDTKASQAALLEEVKTFKPGLEIRLPGLNFSDLVNTVDEQGYLHIPWIGEFLKALYDFGLVIINIVAVVMIIMQGAKIVASGGESKVGAYKKIGQIAVGLVIAWGSYAILYNINPALVEFKSLKVKYIPPDKLESYNENVNPPDATPIVTGGASTFGANGIPDFKQCDSRWKDLPYDGLYKGQPLGCFQESRNGKGQFQGSICTSGCGVTSLADVLVYYGYGSITPVDTAKYGVEVGARVGCFGSRAAILCSNVTSKWGDLKCSMINPQKELDKIISLLRAKKPVIFSCHDCVGFTKNEQPISFKAHFMVLTGVDEGGNWFSVNDPGRQSGMVKIASSEFTSGRIASTFVVEKNN